MQLQLDGGSAAVTGEDAEEETQRRSPERRVRVPATDALERLSS
jgi:hypothetical protein